MAGKKNQISIFVALNDKAAAEGLKSLTQKIKSSTADWSAAFKAVGLPIAALTAGITYAFARWTKASMEATATENRLRAALKARGAEVEKNTQALLRFNASLQQKFGYEADELTSLQAKLAALGVLPKKLEEATKHTLAYSAATGVALPAAATAVANALAGKTNALARAGIQAKTTAEAERQLGALFALVEARAGTLETALSAFGKNLGDIEETLGSSVTQSGAVVGAIGSMNQAFVDLNDYLSGAGKSVMRDFFQFMIVGAGMAIEGLARAFDFLRSPIKNLKKELALAKQGFFAESMTEEEVRAGGPKESMTDLLLRLGARVGQELQDVGISGGTPPPKSPQTSSTPARAGRTTKRRNDQTPADAFMHDAVLQFEREKVVNDALESLQHERERALEDHGQKMAKIQRENNRAIVDEQNAGIDSLARAFERMNAPLDGFRDLLVGGFERISIESADILLEFGNMVSSAFQGLFTDIAEGIGSGNLDVLKSIGGFFGSILKQMGSFMIGLGSAILALGGLGFFIPGLQMFTAAIPKALLIIGAGTVTMALGAALTSGSDGTGRASPAGSGRGGGGAPRGRSVGQGVQRDGGVIPEGFSSRSPQPRTNVYNINLPSALVVGSQAELGRTLRRALDAEARLRGQRVT
jgi:hypothetical protein